MGHCVIISEDTQTYLHCHPEQLWAPKPNDKGGPEIAFHTRFPSPGRYKVWVQCNQAGKMLLAEFVVDVGKSFLPPRIMGLLLGEN